MTGQPEILVSPHILRPTGIVFQIGVGDGAWSEAVAPMVPEGEIHAFEMDAARLRTFCRRARAISSGVSILTQLLDGRTPDGAPPRAFLDGYCRRMGISRVSLLKIDAPGHEPSLLAGASDLLARRAVDVLQIAVRSLGPDADADLARALKGLSDRGYLLCVPGAEALRVVDRPDEVIAPAGRVELLAYAPRLREFVQGTQRGMFDYFELFRDFGIAPRGVVHVGAHHGEEYDNYKRAGVSRIVFVEGDPATAEKLRARFGSHGDVTCIQGLVSSREERVVFHRTSSSQSSSMLPLKEHLSIYPGITETATIELDASPLPRILERNGINPSGFNVLAIDAQGAELLVLRGAEDLLGHFEAIVTEINYEEVYAGCPLVEEIDTFLDAHGFERARETTPYHPAWGDALYIRRRRLSMRTLGSNGRFANQIFQYFFLALTARLEGSVAEAPDWIGERLFGLSAPRPREEYPVLRQDIQATSPADLLAELQSKPRENFDIWGYFQFHTSFYAPYKDLFRSTFTPGPEIRAALERARRSRLDGDETIVACHLRRGDYGYAFFHLTPTEWYLAFLRRIWPRLHKPVLYLASDDIDLVAPDFAEFDPLTSRDLDVTVEDAPFYVDFWMMSQCDVLACANSSFSFAAAMLNERAAMFVRPDIRVGELVPFLPWNCPVLFKDKV
ncbi:FkbM family methyltransferase [Arenibaculum pallidiluteum]|uniref:FkbM family methyltransferase n=1 Tax=Arenibaculum pallidiluteum TaxID=2812559 RepID=UPI001A97779C|nr:FkbM family methyltransferase [Arenibaculum pallidiluteum]